jgi:hypothetical protein
MGAARITISVGRSTRKFVWGVEADAQRAERSPFHQVTTATTRMSPRARASARSQQREQTAPHTRCANPQGVVGSPCLFYHQSVTYGTLQSAIAIPQRKHVGQQVWIRSPQLWRCTWRRPPSGRGRRSWPSKRASRWKLTRSSPMRMMTPKADWPWASRNSPTHFFRNRFANRASGSSSAA